MTVLIVVLIVAILLWLVNGYIPMPPTVKLVFNIVVIVALIVWVLVSTGIIK